MIYTKLTKEAMKIAYNAIQLIKRQRNGVKNTRRQ